MNERKIGKAEAKFKKPPVTIHTSSDEALVHATLCNIPTTAPASPEYIMISLVMISALFEGLGQGEHSILCKLI